MKEENTKKSSNDNSNDKGKKGVAGNKETGRKGREGFVSVDRLFFS